MALDYTWNNALPRLVFAPNCWGCGKAGKESRVCFSCARQLLSGRLDSALLAYQGPALGLMECLRGGAPDFAARYLFRLAEIQGVLGHWSAQEFSWVALAPQSRVTGLRWFGEKVAKRLGVPLKMPFRKLSGHFQHGKNASSRWNAELFLQWGSEEVSPQKVLLLDDVCTTGTTLEQAEFLLRAHGAERVEVFSLARKVMGSIHGEHTEAQQEGDEIDPFLFHLFV